MTWHIPMGGQVAVAAGVEPRVTLKGQPLPSPWDCRCGHADYWHVRLDKPADCLHGDCGCERYEPEDDA